MRIKIKYGKFIVIITISTAFVLAFFHPVTLFVS